MAKKQSGTKTTSPDAGLADIENAAEAARIAAETPPAAPEKPADSCLNCRTPDWRSADGTFCVKLRMELDPDKPIFDCEYWRRPLRG